jgi:hypothetical protein
MGVELYWAPVQNQQGLEDALLRIGPPTVWHAAIVATSSPAEDAFALSAGIRA